jgi:hypothetical protein
MTFTFSSFVANNWKGIAKIFALATVLLVGYHYVSKLFTHDTVTLTKTVRDTTEVAALRRQIQLKEVEHGEDLLALAQFKGMVEDVKASKDSAIAFYERIIADLTDTTHPNSIAIPRATASREFISTVAGKDYRDRVSVVYHFPPLDSFDIDLLLAAREIVTEHEETRTITTVHSTLPDIWAGMTFADESIFAQADMTVDRWKFSVGYRLGTFDHTALDGPLSNWLFGAQYKIF